MFEIPQTLDGLTRTKLVELGEKAIAAFDKLRDDPNLDADGMTRLRSLAQFIKDGRDATTAMDAKQAADAAELAAMTAAIHASDAAAAEPEEAAAEAEEPAVEAIEGEVLNVPARELEPVLASGGAALTRAAATATAGTRDDLPMGRKAVITASADMPGYSNGHRFNNIGELAEAWMARISGFPDQRKMVGTSGFTKLLLKHGVAKIEIPPPAGTLVADGRRPDIEVIDQACDTTRLPGGSLVAAGAWCPPPEQFWDLCGSLISVDGLWDGPSFTYRRTAVSYPQQIDLIPLLDQIGFHYTQADSIAGTPKPCFKFPCVDFDTFEQECDGICIRGDIINDQAWPELLRRQLADALKLHRLKINQSILAQIEAGSTAVDLRPGTDITADTTLTSGLLGALMLAASWYRTSELASRNLDLEVILPAWLPEMIALDQMRRTGCCTPSVATQADISARMRAAGVRVQWVRGWQDWFATAGAFGDPANPATAWPTTLKFIMYAPGAWARGTRSIISLNSVYDSTSLAQNEYTSLFTEECSILINRCYKSMVYTIDICPSGATSAAIPMTCA